jgi:hypothetical protein
MPAMSSDKDARPTSFPQDAASCHAILESVFHSLAEKEKRIGQLEELVDTLIRERCERKSERYNPDQLVLFEADEDHFSVAEPPDTEDTLPSPKQRHGGGHRHLVSNTRRVQRFHRLRDDQKHCPKCGAVLTIALVESKLCWASGCEASSIHPGFVNIPG